MAVLILTDRVDEAHAALQAAGLASGGAAESDLQRALVRLEREPWDLLIIDAAVAGGAALELIEPLALEGRRVAVCAAQPTLAMTLRVLRSGAVDVIPFPPPAQRLRELASDAAGSARGAATEAEAEEEASEWIGSSPVLLDAFRSAQRVAPADVPVLIWGETGTGKERLARVIHATGSRSARPLVSVNCGAIPEGVLESELFGHERGGAPGVFGRRIGRFVKAAGGTLLLDEVEHLTPRLQQRVVQAIEAGTIMPRGATEEVRVDVRVIATAERDPQQLMQEGLLTKNLYAVLGPGAIFLPPLRSRGKEDMRALVLHFAAEFAKRHNRVRPAIDDAAWDILLRHPWPGNVRQLRGAVERAMLEAGAEVVRSADLPRDVANTVERLPSELSLKLEDVEKRHIMRVLEVAENHVGRAASLLGIHRNTLSRKLRSYGLDTQ